MNVQCIDYFTDSVLRAPTIGCMLICLIASVVGVFVVLQRKSLIGEALSHACYPGVIIALFIERLIFQGEDHEFAAMAFVLIGASCSSLLGIYFINFLEKRFRTPADSALSVTLSLFFGIGFTILSALQGGYPGLYKELQAYLFGQAATLRDIHVYVLGVLAFFVLATITIFFRSLKAVVFDPVFSEIIGLKKKALESLLFFMVVFAIVVGIRSVGVVLMSAMLIFPAATSQQFTKHLSTQLFVAALFGSLAGFLGVVSSHELSMLFLTTGTLGKISSFPTGPMIVMVASLFFIFAILFAPKKGLFLRFFKKMNFSVRCDKENLLKMIWKKCSAKKSEQITFEEIQECHLRQGLYLWFLVQLLQRKGFLRPIGKNRYILTPWGMLWGRKIVRLHRLWEVYLVEYCKVAKERVHPSAEVMEHIITPEIEKELAYLLHNPEKDPHAQPIPPEDEVFLLGGGMQ